MTSMHSGRGKSIAVREVTIEHSPSAVNLICPICNRVGHFADQIVRARGVEVGRTCGIDPCRSTAIARALRGEVWNTDAPNPRFSGKIGEQIQVNF